MTQRQLGFVIDLKRCIGCRTCMVGCKMENGVPIGQFWIRVFNPENRITNDRPVGRFPNLHMYWLPVPCQHCSVPPCVGACPAGALRQRQEDGIVLVDEDQCDGCQECVSACPYDALYFDEKNGTIEKCTMCNHRIEKGKEPYCATVCIGRAIHFGDFKDPNSHVNKLLRHRNYYILKEEQGTRPSVYYLNYPPK